MENWNTKVLPSDDESIAQAAALLQAGEVVGFPTETVYGLAANAYDTKAVAKIFKAKGRPQDNPLIVHIASLDMLSPLVSEVPELAKKLAKAFWPGPMTMILPKSDRIPDAVSAGLSTVGIRYPSSETARKMILASGLPLAAPSGNLSGHPSPTTAAHMLHDMNGRIPMIIDGGECEVGLESTVILVKPDRVRLLRPGGITVEMLEEICPVEVDNGVLHAVAPDAKVASPGMKYRHYAPVAEVTIVEGSLPAFDRYMQQQAGDGVYAMVFDVDEKGLPVPALPFGKEGHPEDQAYRLFDLLRKCDDLGAKKVFVRSPDQSGIGLAVYNRLLRAAAFRIVKLEDEE